MSETTPSSPVCIDSGLVVRRVLPAVDPTGGAARALWSQWMAEGRDLVAPTLLRYEITNAFHRLAHSGRISSLDASDALQAALAVPLRLHSEVDLHERALEMASRFRLPAVYDSHFLSLAEGLGVEFWTTDQRLFYTVSAILPWVRLVGGSPTAP